MTNKPNFIKMCEAFCVVSCSQQLLRGSYYFTMLRDSVVILANGIAVAGRKDNINERDPFLCLPGIWQLGSAYPYQQPSGDCSAEN